ncbi:MAG: indolepyruvate ferredoxin oxidoreductase subunit alpha [Promethearchaeota archaeon]
MTQNVPYFAEDAPGKKAIMLGNEAIARGILEAGVVIGSGYPGTPSSEILETVAAMVKYHPHLNIEWSINEKVGFEVAFGGSMSNARSVACMKHVGLNVAADAFMTACYAGARGGFVVVSADDPNCYSSQNEQDNRYYGLHALVPVFEPSTPHEAKELMKYAFDFSEENNSVVLFRTTTRLNHGRGDVTLGEIKKIKRDYGFDWDRSRWTFLPTNARVHRVKLLERLDKITALADEFPFNNLEIHGERFNGMRYGFLSAGVPYAHLADTLVELGLEGKVSFLKLGMVYPPPKKLVKEFLESVDKVLVVEELEPFLENILKQEAYEHGLSKEVEIHGKDLFPQNGEFPAELYREKVAEFVGIEYRRNEPPGDTLAPPPRPPVLCPGCSHRTTFYALKLVAKELGTRFINSSDIGCYTLGFYPPLEGVDTCICMGASIGLANGISKLEPKGNPVLAILGDSTFFHSGIPALINAVYNGNEILVVICDNRITAMTGFQDHPGTGVKITKEPGTMVVVEELVKGCGVAPENVWISDSNDLPELVQKFREAVTARGVRVFISRHTCALLQSNRMRAARQTPPRIEVDQDKCVKCMLCIKNFGCPALTLKDERVVIDPTLCTGCGVCVDVCPQGAIHELIRRPLCTPSNETRLQRSRRSSPMSL